MKTIWPWNFSAKREEYNLLQKRIEKANEILSDLIDRHVTLEQQIIHEFPPEIDWNILKAVSVSRIAFGNVLATNISYFNERGILSALKFDTSDEGHKNIVLNFVKWKEKNNV